MHLIFCVEEKGGISFCGRRLSRDKAVYAHILALCSCNPLWIAPASASLFPEGAVLQDPAFLQKAGTDHYCFLETVPQMELLRNADSVILYHWNRHYPATEKFPFELLEGMRCIHTEEFMGNSHEKITMERYIR